MADSLQLARRLPDPSPNRGRLLTAQEVADLIGVSAAWVRRHVPGKIRLGHSTVRWFASDVYRWLAHQQEEAG